ncbi:hypothetical protein CVT24_000210 [Panaeolus cyanescens]|uniref:Uncharacterized protein n=1 Tax=Panaeolus cyanescens TaxID=181874 RepID=A0A409VIQ3_9AGAR|nr:hypothetical protein CVT24_000210 [Panaeolus cyanescens]
MVQLSNGNLIPMVCVILAYLALLASADDDTRINISPGAHMAELPPVDQNSQNLNADIQPCSFVRILHIRLGHAIPPRLRPQWMNNSRLQSDCTRAHGQQPTIQPKDPLQAQVVNTDDGGPLLVSIKGNDTAQNLAHEVEVNSKDNLDGSPGSWAFGKDD